MAKWRHHTSSVLGDAQVCDIDALLLERALVALAVVVVAHLAEHDAVGAEACGHHALVRALAAIRAHEAVRVDGLAELGLSLQVGEVVDVQRAEHAHVELRHVAGYY